MPLNKVELSTRSHFCVFSNNNHRILIHSFLLHRNEIQDLSLNILFDVGPAMSLGFLIHLFLHFVIIASKTSEQPHQPEPAPETQIGFRNPEGDTGSVRSSMGSLISNDVNGNEAVS